MIWYLLLAGILINGVHGYLLWSQRDERKWSISVHAIKNRRTHALYIAGHIFAGFFFLLFAKEFFVNLHNAPALFNLALLTYVFEIIQAILPSKDKYEKAHTIAALLMWLSFVTAGLLSIGFLNINTISRVIAATFYAPLLIMLVRSYFDRSRLYYYQMNMVLLFYGAIFALALGS